MSIKPGVYTDREDTSVIHLIGTDGTDIMVDWPTYQRVVPLALGYGQGFMGGRTADGRTFEVSVHPFGADHAEFRCHPTSVAPEGLFPPPYSDQPVDLEAQRAFVDQMGSVVPTRHLVVAQSELFGPKG